MAFQFPIESFSLEYTKWPKFRMKEISKNFENFFLQRMHCTRGFAQRFILERTFSFLFAKITTERFASRFKWQEMELYQRHATSEHRCEGAVCGNSLPLNQSLRSS